MFEAFDPTEIVACALRPRGSWAHLAILVAFVLAAASLSPGARTAR